MVWTLRKMGCHGGHSATPTINTTPKPVPRQRSLWWPPVKTVRSKAGRFFTYGLWNGDIIWYNMIQYDISWDGIEPRWSNVSDFLGLSESIWKWLKNYRGKRMMKDHPLHFLCHRCSPGATGRSHFLGLHPNSEWVIIHWCILGPGLYMIILWLLNVVDKGSDSENASM